MIEPWVARTSRLSRDGERSSSRCRTFPRARRTRPSSTKSTPHHFFRSSPSRHARFRAGSPERRVFRGTALERAAPHFFRAPRRTRSRAKTPTHRFFRSKSPPEPRGQVSHASSRRGLSPAGADAARSRPRPARSRPRDEHSASLAARALPGRAPEPHVRVGIAAFRNRAAPHDVRVRARAQVPPEACTRRREVLETWGVG